MPGLLAVIALVVAVIGLVRLAERDYAVGAVLLLVAFAIGPGGWTIFR